MSSSASAGSKRGMSTCVPELWAIPSVINPQPATWNSGIGLTVTSPGPCVQRLEREPRVVGKPAVVKDSAFRPAGGPGGVEDLRRIGWIDLRQTLFGAAEPQKRAHSASEIASRSSGSRSRSSARLAGSELPRYSGTKKMPRAREWSSTYSSSSARRPGSPSPASTLRARRRTRARPIRGIAGATRRPARRAQTARAGPARRAPPRRAARRSATGLGRPDRGCRRAAPPRRSRARPPCGARRRPWSREPARGIGGPVGATSGVRKHDRTLSAGWAPRAGRCAALRRCRPRRGASMPRP